MKKLILIVIVIGLLVFLGYRYLNQNHRNIAEEAPMAQVEAQKLLQEFHTKYTESEHKYLNNTLQIQGTLTAINETSLVLENNIYCELDKTPSLSETSKGTTITIKGRLIGFDDLLGELKLDQCTVITTKNL